MNTKERYNSVDTYEANEIYQNLIHDGLLSEREVTALEILINSSGQYITERMQLKLCENCIYYNKDFGECTELCLRVKGDSYTCYGSSHFRSRYLERT